MKGVMATLHSMANGGFLPRWVRMVGLGAALGIQAALLYSGFTAKIAHVDAKVDRLEHAVVDYARADSFATAEARRDRWSDRNDFVRVTQDMNEEHRRIWTSMGKRAQHRDIRP